MLKYNLITITSKNINAFIDEATTLMQKCFPVHYVSFDKSLIRAWIDDDYYCWVGARLIDGKLVGLINARKENNCIILQDLCVGEAYRRKGIATALAKEAVNKSVEKWGVTTFRGYATVMNSAHEIAQRIGFSSVKKLPEHHIKGSPVIEMAMSDKKRREK